MNFYKLEGSIYNTLLHIFFEIKNKITYVKTLNLYIETDKYNYIIQVLDEIGLDSPIIHIEEIKEYFPSGEKKILMEDRKSTRLNSSHVAISYAVFCLKKKKEIS